MIYENEIAVLDLFSGYSGFHLGFALANAIRPDEPRRLATRSETAGGRSHGELGGSSRTFRTIAFSEIDPYCCALLKHRFPHIPNLGRVQHVTRDSVLRATGVLPAVVTGGFPCQPASCAGKRAGMADERWLWDECRRVLDELRPRFGLFENVPGLLTVDGGRAYARIVADLARIGYASLRMPLSAAAVGAPHLRKRIFIIVLDQLAFGARGGRGELRESSGGDGQLDGCGEDVADANRTGFVQRCGAEPVRPKQPAVEYGGQGVDHPNQGGQPGRSGVVATEQNGDGQDNGLPFAASGDGLDWPASRGLWPARPGQRQFGWEPSRTVLGHAKGIEDSRKGQTGLQSQPAQSGRKQRRQAQSLVGRDADGTAAQLDAVANRVQRLKALGNGVLPQCVAPFAIAIREFLTSQDAG